MEKDLTIRHIKLDHEKAELMEDRDNLLSKLEQVEDYIGMLKDDPDGHVDETLAEMIQILVELREERL